jgi:AraC-like DNA-binding protein
MNRKKISEKVNARYNTASKNPYLVSYLSLALICCILLTVVFLYASMRNARASESAYRTEKLNLAAEDFETQMNELSTIGLKISVDRHFQPFYYERNKYYEKELLEILEEYTNYTVFSGKYFLYYKDSDRIFTSSEKTSQLNQYLQLYLPEDSILEFTQNLNQLPDQINFTCENGRLFIQFPLKIMNNGEYNAVLCFIVTEEEIGSRISNISGGLAGSYSLYAGTTLLYRTDDDSPSLSSPEKAESAVSGNYTILLYPDSNMPVYFPFQVLLILCAVIFLLVIATILAWRSSMPLIRLAQKLKSSVPEAPKTEYSNQLEEIDSLADQVIRQNDQAAKKITEKQRQIQEQALLMLLSSRFSYDLKPYLTESGLTLPGPWYSVLCISTESTNNPKSLARLTAVVQELSDTGENLYLYPVQVPDQSCLAVVASLASPSRWESVCNDVRELAQSALPDSATAAGGCYEEAGNLAASFLEAMDRLHQPAATQPGTAAGTAQQPGVWQAPDYQPVISAMESGSEELMQTAVKAYADQLRTPGLSLLMERYITADFLSKVTETAYRHHIFFSHQSLSLILASGNIDDFEKSASRLLLEYSEKYRQQQEEISHDEKSGILQYIDSHFTSFDFSIESAADDLSVTPAAIRSAVKEKSGKTFRDYVIDKRMELACALLTVSDLSVSDTCEKIGYTNVSYFIKAFKARYGVTPANYKLAGSRIH